MDKLDAMRCIDKLDRIGRQGVKDLLTIGRKDQSGAFTPGLGLDENQAELVMMFVCDTKGATNEETLYKMNRWFAVMAMSNEELTVFENLISRYDSVVE